MGWDAFKTRRHTAADLFACFDGWLKAQGHSTGPDMSDEAVAELDALMERYPDG